MEYLYHFESIVAISSGRVFSKTSETGRGIIIWNSIVTITAVALIIFSLATWLLLTEKDIFSASFLLEWNCFQAISMATSKRTNELHMTDSSRWNWVTWSENHVLYSPSPEVTFYCVTPNLRSQFKPKVNPTKAISLMRPLANALL